MSVPTRAVPKTLEVVEVKSPGRAVAPEARHSGTRPWLDSGALIAIIVLLLTSTAWGQSSDSSIIPHWCRFQDAPTMPTTKGATLTGITNQGAGCPEILSIVLPPRDLASTYFDSVNNVTQLYVAWYPVVRYDIDAELNYTMTELPVDYGLPWTVADLDLDGNLDMVLQRGDGYNGFLDIHSAPSWEQRSRATFPGLNVYFDAVAVNVDADPYLEVFATPSSLATVMFEVDSPTSSFANASSRRTQYDTRSPSSASSRPVGAPGPSSPFTDLRSSQSSRPSNSSRRRAGIVAAAGPSGRR